VGVVSFDRRTTFSARTTSPSHCFAMGPFLSPTAAA
jgi:hypothetical protein